MDASRIAELRALTKVRPFDIKVIPSDALGECLDTIESLTAQLENVLDSHSEGAWMARALDAERENERLRKALESGVAAAEKVLAVHKEAAADNGMTGDQRKSDMAFGACCAAQSVLDELRDLARAALADEKE
jgi:hypothetical protein